MGAKPALHCVVAAAPEPLMFSDERDFRAARREWEALVRRDHGMVPTERLLILHLASFAGPDRLAWPAAHTLADEIGVSVATAKRALKAARERGWIMPNRKRFFGGSMEYRLSVRADVVREIEDQKKIDIAVRKIRRNGQKPTPVNRLIDDTIGGDGDASNGITHDTTIGSPMTPQ